MYGLSEQRLLLTIFIESARWKEERLDPTLKAPFQKLRLSNCASYRKVMVKKGFGAKIEELAPQVGFEPTTLRLTASLLMFQNKGVNF